MSDPYGGLYPLARAAARERSSGKCQLCGLRPGTDAHHWAMHYPPGNKVKADDLTWLCPICHDFATTMRRLHRYGGDVFKWRALALSDEVIEQCTTTSKSRVSARSSCTTERPDSTRDPLPTSKRQRSPASVVPTEPQPTIPDSGSLSAKPRFGLTRAERRQSRQPPSEQ